MMRGKVLHGSTAPTKGMRDSRASRDYEVPARKKGVAGKVCTQPAAFRPLWNSPHHPGKGNWMRAGHGRRGGASHDAHMSITHAHSLTGAAGAPAMRHLYVKTRLLVFHRPSLACQQPTAATTDKGHKQVQASPLLRDQEPLYNEEGASRLVWVCTGQRGGQVVRRTKAHALSLATSRGGRRRRCCPREPQNGACPLPRALLPAAVSPM